MSSSTRLWLLALLGALLAGVVLALTRPAPMAHSPARDRTAGSGGWFVAGPRWTKTPSSARFYYADDRGRPVAGLVGAVVADAGYCAGLPTSTRAVAGLAALTRGDLASATRGLAQTWVVGVTGRSPPELPASAVAPGRLSDGAPAVRVHLRLRTRPSDDPCLAERVVLDVVGFASGSAVACFVVVRDLAEEGITGAEVERMVQSLRRRT